MGVSGRCIAYLATCNPASVGVCARVWSIEPQSWFGRCTHTCVRVRNLAV